MLWVNPHELFFSQSSVGEGVEELVLSMAQGGYDRQHPVNVVLYPDGRMVTFDNRRVLAARRAGLKVYARVHKFDAPAYKAIRCNPLIREPIRFCDGTVKALPAKPTWADTVEMRLLGGARFNGGYAPEVGFFPPGRLCEPVVRASPLDTRPTETCSQLVSQASAVRAPSLVSQTQLKRELPRVNERAPAALKPHSVVFDPSNMFSGIANEAMKNGTGGRPGVTEGGDARKRRQIAASINNLNAWVAPCMKLINPLSGPYERYKALYRRGAGKPSLFETEVDPRLEAWDELTGGMVGRELYYFLFGPPEFDPADSMRWGA